MQNLDPKLARTVSWLAGLSAVLITISLPLGYFIVSYRYMEGVLETRAEINATTVSQMINTHPENWQFQQHRLEDLLRRRRGKHPEIWRILDTENKLVAEKSDPVTPPVMLRSQDLLDAGVPVARIEIGRSLRPLLYETGGLAFLALLLGWGSFVVLRVLPLRVLRRVLADKRRLLNEAHRSKQKLQMLNTSLSKFAADLRRSNQELEQFAYIASHDLQEPLRMITGYTSLLAKRYKGKLDSEADEFIDYAMDGAKRMQALINALLTYSRVGTKGKEFTPTDCEAVLQSAFGNLEVVIKDSSALVTHDPLPIVVGDGSQLQQLLQNLIDNGIKFRNEKAPVIHVSCRREGKEWLFSVKDNGIGIDPQYAERIFVLFQRLHTRAEYPGTGIGLAVCKRIVGRHGGRIWVESEPGTGATFNFTLPV